MTNLSSKIAGNLLILNGVLHIAVLIVGNFALSAVTVSVIGAVSILLGAWINRGMPRAISYLAFLLACIGASYAIVGVYQSLGIASLLFVAILVVTILAAATLFAKLWSKPKFAQPE